MTTKETTDTTIKTPLTPGASLSNVTKTLKGRLVLNNVTATFPKGNISGIRGPNGCGKSMLLRAVAGLIRLDSGSVELLGTPINAGDALPITIGALIEPINLWDDMTGFENLQTLASLRNNVNDDDIKTTISRVGLNPDDKRKVKSYSLGMCQRLEIAQAIMDKPDIILLDEPTNALDEDGRALIAKITSEERKRGATILVVSHDKDELLSISDYIYEMNDGRIIKEGRSDEM